jgi:hypothetical protein
MFIDQLTTGASLTYNPAIDFIEINHSDSDSDFAGVADNYIERAFSVSGGFQNVYMRAYLSIYVSSPW